MSEDLGLSKSKDVSRALGLLSGRKYKAFLDFTDTWCSQEYSTPQEHLAWNQLACLLKKYPFDDPMIDRRGVALEKFSKAEHTCKRINQRFVARRLRAGVRPSPNEHLLDRARRYIVKVLGREPNLDTIFDMCDFGPGASIGTHGDTTHVAEKLSGEWTVTHLCAPVAIAALSRNAQVWEVLSSTPLICYDHDLFREAASSKVRYVHSNKITLVPKTAKTDRVIAIEPTLNGYVQKGIDQFMRKRLLAHGIDLSDQTRNQDLARQGSMGGANPFSTIDLSSASDTISREIVKELLPAEWFNLLNRVRSHSYDLDGNTLHYEKFTSMGNGFCFPLETLIFASIVAACYEDTGDREFSVYGDDIIVRQSSALAIIEMLKYCGFTTNVEKTFIFGSFRESCGADWFEGVNVRPYYIDEVPRNWYDIFKWLNGISGKHGFHRAWNFLFGEIPPAWRFTRPYLGADDSISVPYDFHMGSPYCSWDRNLQTFRYARVVHSAIADNRSFGSGIEMYGALRGSPSFGEGRVEFAFRRKTRTKLVLSS